jgi:hypothetical protein
MDVPPAQWFVGRTGPGFCFLLGNMHPFASEPSRA